MKIRWPELKTNDCLYLSLCGSLLTDDEDVLGELKRLEPKPWIARCKSRNGPDWLRLDCDLDGKHLHLDAARNEYFGGGFKPTQNHTIAALQKELSLFLSYQIKITIFATFAVPYATIPKRGLIQDKVVENEQLGIRMTGGRFEFRGIPVVQLEWRATQGGREITVDVKLRREVKITENYIVHALKVARIVFDGLVMGSMPDATDQTDSFEQITEAVS